MTSMRLLPSRAPAAVINPIVGGLASAGVTPNMLSVAGLLGNGVAALLIAQGHLAVGGIVMLLASALDMLDGALARATGKASPFGALLDSVFDRLSEAAVLFGVVLYALDRGNEDQAALAFVAIVGSLMVSYVRARAEGLGVSMTDGLFTRPERVIVLGAALLIGWLTPALWLLAVLTMLTAFQRLYLGARALASDSPTADSEAQR
jgi:CDP-diacylglycerol--glycerol-3-phosphate 3-phosphatidyltransferase